MARSTEPIEFEHLRPRLLALIELHRAANNEPARAAIIELLEDLFLTTAWHVATDLLDNGWRPTVVDDGHIVKRRLRIVGGADAA